MVGIRIEVRKRPELSLYIHGFWLKICFRRKTHEPVLKSFDEKVFCSYSLFYAVHSPQMAVGTDRRGTKLSTIFSDWRFQPFFHGADYISTSLETDIHVKKTMEDERQQLQSERVYIQSQNSALDCFQAESAELLPKTKYSKTFRVKTHVGQKIVQICLWRRYCQWSIMRHKEFMERRKRR